MIDVRLRPELDEAELEALHASGFGPSPAPVPWRARLERFSVGWAGAHDGDRLVGFVNVVGDDGVHGFLVDTVVAVDHRRTGIGRRLVETARTGARAAGCHWLHVDHEPHLTPFSASCGFTPTAAGVLRP